MPLGSLAGSSDQQYIAIKDGAETWRILNTWHEDLKMMDAEDDIPDGSEAVTILSEGQFIALIKEAASQGVLSNVSFNDNSEEHEEEIANKDIKINELTSENTKLKSNIEIKNSELEHKSQHSEDYDLKEKAMDSILKLVSIQDMANLSKD